MAVSTSMEAAFCIPVLHWLQRVEWPAQILFPASRLNYVNCPCLTGTSLKESVLKNEAALLSRIAEGDEDAFASLYMGYMPRLKAYAWKFTQSPEDTAEILQESFLLIWLNREKLPELEHAQAWIYKIVARCCLQWLRKQKSDNSRNNLVMALAVNDHIPTPSDVLQWQELTNTLQATIKELPDIKQQIYRLNREEGLKPAAIADLLQMPVGTVKNHLSIAVKTLRAQLLDAGYPVEMLLCLPFLFF